MNTQIELVSEDALDAVVGGMNCGTATAIAGVYLTVAQIISTFGGGTPVASEKMGELTGMAKGITQGTCPA